MTEAMIVEAVRAAGQAQGVQGTAAVAQALDPQAVRRFQAAMAPQGPTEIPFAAQVAETFGAAQSGYQAHLHRIEALASLSGTHALSAGELSTLQYEIANLSFQQEIVSNIAKKASDAVTTLVKNG